MTNIPAPNTTPLAPLPEFLLKRFGEPSHSVCARRMVASAFELDSRGDTVLCHRRATADALSSRHLDEMLAYCAREGLKPRLLVISHGSGNLPYEERADCELIEELVSETGAECVLWSSPDVLARSATVGLQHIKELDGLEVELHLLGHGAVDPTRDQLLLDIMFLPVWSDRAAAHAGARAWRAREGS